LRNILLINTNRHWNREAGICKEYVRNPQGVDYLRAVLKNHYRESYEKYQEEMKRSESEPKDNYSTILPYCNGSPVNQQWDYQCVKKWVLREYDSEFESGFNYEDKSNRLWHPIQNISNQYRQQIMSEQGYRHNYDIAAAAPTLILREAQRINAYGDLDLWQWAIQDLLANRDYQRYRLSLLAECDVRKIKVMINALFCGARLGCNPQYALSQLFNNDRIRINRLRNDSWLGQLISEIKTCWRSIEVTMERREHAETGRKLPLSSRQKWARYFELERRVQNSICRYLEENNNAYFLEHDGFCSRDPVNLTELDDYIYQDTGYWIHVESKR